MASGVDIAIIGDVQSTISDSFHSLVGNGHLQ